MNLVLPLDERSEWMTLSNSILRVTKLPSIGELLDQALSAWLKNISPELRWNIAIDLYTQQEISSGKAAEIAGLNYFVFLKKLNDANIEFIAADVYFALVRNALFLIV